MAPVLMVMVAGNALTLTIPDLADTSDYWFCVKAYDDVGNESVCSNVVHSPPVVDAQPPAMINNFRYKIN